MGGGQSLTLNLEFAILAKLNGSKAPRILLALPAQRWDHRLSATPSQADVLVKACSFTSLKAGAGGLLKSALKSDKLDSKVKRIGPHIEIFQLFQGRNKIVYTRRIIKRITVIQAFVRGWLECRRLQRITTKALYHGPSLKVVINMYRALIHRIRHRLGLWRTRQVIDFSEIEEWMDRKKFYETMFAKREDWRGLERSELLKCFNDCGHFPTQAQIGESWDLLHRHSRGKYSEVIKKSNAIELLFTIYPPRGAKVNANMHLKSTWLRPMVNGEEGYKYIVSGHPILKRANIRTVGNLVANSIRERKMRQF
ncbi:IQ domain-containing protein M [Nannospalax galili]|uniref:IQ domain-containing protein M n=1 Tax=Nannospalax galili TaxID=1026970 RepID=UPI0004ED5664|nr:IQ domain-containing protein M [Nannospalax galili]